VFPWPRTAYARFRRALKTRSLHTIRAAAAELPRMGLDDALGVCLVVRDTQPDRFDAARVRWIGRYCAERPNIRLELVDAAVACLRELQRGPEAGLERLQLLAATELPAPPPAPPERADGCSRRREPSLGRSSSAS